MLSQIHEWVASLSALTGLDDWLLSGGLFTVLLWVGKHTGLKVLRRIAGEHLPLGEEGANVLDKLEQGGWMVTQRKAGKIQHTAVLLDKLVVSPDEPAVLAGGRDVLPFLNRRERRLIFAAAREVRKALALAKVAVDRQAINADLTA